MKKKTRVIRVNEEDKVTFAKLLVKITFIMLCISVGIKLLGFNIFDANQSNKILLFISTIIYNYNLIHIVNFLLLFIQTFIILRISCKNDNRKIYYITTCICVIITLFTQHFIIAKLLARSSISDTVYLIFSLLIVVIPAMIIDIKIKFNLKRSIPLLFKVIVSIWNRVKMPLLISLVIMIYQILVIFIRNITLQVDRDIYIYNFLLNFDYIILLITTYYIFIKNKYNLELELDLNFLLVSFFHERPSISTLKNMISGIREKQKEFKKQKLEDKIVFILYVTFFIITELVNLGLIIFVANLNHYLTECIFIIIGFMMSRKVFGAFHFKSAIKCFVVSNISFFILNKITINTDMSFVIPIFLGLTLSLGTSLLIKKTNKSLYRGMSKDELLLICKDKELTTLEMNILEDFYCNRMSIIEITLKYHYSETQIYRFKSKAIKKIES